MTRKIIILVLLVILAFKPMGVFAQDKVVLKVGVLPIIESLPLAISGAQSAIANSNITVQVEVFSTWTALEAAYRTGIVDIAAMTAPKAIKMAGNNIPLKILMSLHRNGNMLVTNFTQDSAEQFEGTIIGVSGNDTGQLILLSEFIKKQGLKLGPQVRYIAIPQSKALELLSSGKIQGFLLSEPYGSMALAEGIAKQAFPGVEIMDNFVDVLLIANPLIIKSHQKEVKKLVEAVNQAGKMITKDVVSSKGKQAAFSQLEILGIDPEIVSMSLCSPISKIRFDDLTVSLDELKKIEKLALSLGILNAGIDLSKITDTQFSQ
ncbi:MAG: ABC transporter substrate-binding protein [Candidatus Omnitrophica bacterium]|nr:ABC transporter substrate-binding protein [Candidatus Omnitrophota bacterium]